MKLQKEIIQWARDRQIIPNAKPYTQLMKAMSEMGELCDAELQSDLAGIIDGVGDTLVCLIVYCSMHKISLESCLEAAYDEIKDRRGTMLSNGVFVKDE